MQTGIDQATFKSGKIKTGHFVTVAIFVPGVVQLYIQQLSE
jgi:hypothetical protein